jgi:arginyl-tRNA synthetase
MFNDIQQIIEEKIETYGAAHDIPLATLKWMPIPFSGEWGMSTSFFKPRQMKRR